MSYDKTYIQGLPNEDLREAYYTAVYSGDCNGINATVRAQRKETAQAFGVNENEIRLQVDADIFTTDSPDIDVYEDVINDAPQPGTHELDQQMLFVEELAQLRDAPLTSDERAHLPQAHREVSWFLRDVVQTQYAAGFDYITSELNYKAYLAGIRPKRAMATADTPRTITTGRDAARFVHDDDPAGVYLKAFLDLRRQGVAMRKAGENELTLQQDFASWGAPFLAALIGETLHRAGLVSFRIKKARRAPRPIQYFYQRFGRFLPAAYIEGNPMHERDNAMHSVAYLALSGLGKELFDNYHVLPSAYTVANEFDLLADNGGLWRLDGAVHVVSDHEGAKTWAPEIGKRVAYKYLGIDDSIRY